MSPAGRHPDDQSSRSGNLNAIEASASLSIMIVKLKKSSARYRDLTFGQPYIVIGIEADELRLERRRPFFFIST